MRTWKTATTCSPSASTARSHLIADKIANPKQGRRFGADPGKTLGDHPDKGGPIVVKNGRFGPYVSNNGINATLPSDKTPETITLDEAIVLLEARAAQVGNSPRGKKAPKKAASAEGLKSQRQEDRRRHARDRRRGRSPPVPKAVAKAAAKPASARKKPAAKKPAVKAKKPARSPRFRRRITRIRPMQTAGSAVRAFAPNWRSASTPLTLHIISAVSAQELSFEQTS